MAVGDAYVFPGFLTPVLTQLFFPKPPTTFLTCFCRGEGQKYAGKKSCLNRGSNSQPPVHESDTPTTEPPRWGLLLRSCTGLECNWLALWSAQWMGTVSPNERISLKRNSTNFKSSYCVSEAYVNSL